MQWTLSRRLLLSCRDSDVPDAAERLVLTLVGTINSDIVSTRVPAVRMSVLRTGGLRDASNTCQNATVTSYPLVGTWGDASQPQFLSSVPAIAVDYGGQAGLGVGDAVLLRFNQPVAQVGVASRSQLDKLLVFEPQEWASNYSGVWLDYTSLLVTVGEVGSQATGVVRGSAVGALRVRVVPGGNLTSLDGTSAPCNDSVIVGAGSWGDPVCDAGLFVFSHTALVVAFQPSTVGSYAPTSFWLQLSPSLGFGTETSGDAGSSTSANPSVNVTTIAVNASQSLALSLPSGTVGAGALRFVVQGLQSGTAYFARVGPVPPELPSAAAAVLPSPVPVVYTMVGSCSCASLADGGGGGGCGTGSASPVAVAPQRPQVGE